MVESVMIRSAETIFHEELKASLFASLSLASQLSKNPEGLEIMLQGAESSLIFVKSRKRCFG
jgi:hypothetical protein